MKLRIGENYWGDKSKSWWFISDGSSNYLWQDGKIHPATGYWDADKCFDKTLGYWSTKEEAERFLTNYERKQNMSERSVQIEKDIKLLEAERDKIKVEEAEKSRTFKMGQYFKLPGGVIVRLVQSGPGEYCVITRSGNRFQDSIKTEGYNITKDELCRMSTYSDLTPIEVEVWEVV